MQVGSELSVEQITGNFYVTGVAELCDWKGGVRNGVVQSRRKADI